jgi:hypothetical protein
LLPVSGLRGPYPWNTAITKPFPCVGRASNRPIAGGPPAFRLLTFDQPSSGTGHMSADPFTLRQADQVRTDFAIIEDELEAIHKRLSQLPTRNDVMGMLGGRSQRSP